MLRAELQGSILMNQLDYDYFDLGTYPDSNSALTILLFFLATDLNKALFWINIVNYVA